MLQSCLLRQQAKSFDYAVGAGKTTLLDMMAGHVKASSGGVFLNADRTCSNVRQRSVYVPQVYQHAISIYFLQ